jgi:hypothetical protein
MDLEERNDERRQRNPGKKRVSVSRKAEGEKNAGNEREDQGLVTWPGPRC